MRMDMDMAMASRFITRKDTDMASRIRIKR